MNTIMNTDVREWAEDQAKKNYDSDGLAVTTYATCGVCGKASKGKYVAIYGIHSGCENGGLYAGNLGRAASIPKSKKFAPLRKFTKNAKQAKTYPVLGFIWVRVVENTLVCLMTDLEVVKQATIPNVSGGCIDICVPRDTFVDTLNLLDTDKFVLVQDDEKMILEIRGENFVTKIKGIDSAEFPRQKLEVVYLN